MLTISICLRYNHFASTNLVRLEEVSHPVRAHGAQTRRFVVDLNFFTFENHASERERCEVIIYKLADWDPFQRRQA